MPRKQSLKEFISKAKKLHRNYYDYSKVKYLNSRSEVIIICPEHGNFKQTPKSHIASRKSRGVSKPAGCPDCGEIVRIKKIVLKNKTRKQTTAGFVQNSKTKFGERFLYGKVKYKERNLEVIITCKLHGDFQIKPQEHYKTMHGGCTNCLSEHMSEVKTGIPSKRKGMALGPSKRKGKSWGGWSQKRFVKESNKKHKNFYDYTYTIFTVTNAEVKINCPNHGEFSQIASEHLRGRGCEKCGRKETGLKKRVGFAKWKKAANKMHKGYYLYDKNSFTTSKHYVRIKCPKHGWFKQKAGMHAYAGQGCDLCGNLSISESRTRKYKEFIKKAKNIHGQRYDYSSVKYDPESGNVIYEKNKKGLLTIICKIHGAFEVPPSLHASKKYRQGCGRCVRSKGEDQISMYLKKKNLKFIDHWRDHDCKDVKKLVFDFYIPSRLTVIEFDGPHHFRPIKYYKKMTDEQALESYRGTLKRDKIKNDWCTKNDILMLRIPYTEDVNSILDQKLGF